MLWGFLSSLSSHIPFFLFRVCLSLQGRESDEIGGYLRAVGTNRCPPFEAECLRISKKSSEKQGDFDTEGAV